MKLPEKKGQRFQLLLVDAAKQNIDLDCLITFEPLHEDFIILSRFKRALHFPHGLVFLRLIIEPRKLTTSPSPYPHCTG